MSAGVWERVAKHFSDALTNEQRAAIVAFVEAELCAYRERISGQLDGLFPTPLRDAIKEILREEERK